MKYFLIVIFVIGLIYVLIPEPGSVDQFPPLLASLKSDEPGDTIQVPNVSAYFSNFDRKAITEFYRNEYRKNFLFGGLILPISLNYSPNDANQYVRDKQISTFLEEYVYPLHGSIFVNGYEEYIGNQLLGRRHDPRGDHMEIKGRFFESKTTLHFYPSLWIVRLITYLGIWVALIALSRVFMETWKKEII